MAIEKSKIKSRFTSLDVRAVTRELRASLEGAHLQNIYDVNPRTLLLKFTKREAKVLLLVEAGVRVHATRYDRESPNVLPSSFAAKLRKHLRERRLTRFEQLGFDRVIHLEFGHDSRPELAMHLYIELYATGNIVLTDYRYTVISLVREVLRTSDGSGAGHGGETSKLLAVGLPFNCENFQNLHVSDQTIEHLSTVQTNESVKNVLKSALPAFSPSMVEECLFRVCLDRRAKIVDCRAYLPELIAAVKLLAEQVESPDLQFSGSVVVRREGETDEIWTEFHPMPPLLLEPNAQILSFPTFNEAVDQFFFRLEDRRTRDKKELQESAISKKFDAIKREQELRIESLEAVISKCLLNAQVVEANIQAVEAAILVVNTGLRNDMSWADLENLITAEKQRGRPTALTIEKLKLQNSLIELALPFGESQQERHHLDVDVRLAGYANSGRYYDLRKAAMDKLDRTKAAFEKAMRSAQAKVREDNRTKKRTNQRLIPKRKPLWFEKFNWFVTSDTYLVISGKDMHQNEYLVKRLLKSGDVYAHADLAGASSVIVKNHRKPDDDSQAIPPIPSRTLSEAGAFCLCFSKAWDAKIVTSAWWVHAHQVSKTAPSGEHLSTGSFMIRGKKNFLPPAQLALGFGFMFFLDEQSTTQKRAARLEREAAAAIAAAQGQISGPSGEAENLDTADDSKYMELISPTNDEEESIVTATVGVKNLEIKESGSKPADSNDRSFFPEASSTSEGTAPKKKTNIRGKHGKQKKIKEKYRNQDEEEREAKMQLLASRPKKPATKIAAPPLKIPQTKVARPKNHPKPLDSGVVEETDEDGGNDLGELAVLDSLTGNPSSTETLIGAIAVAAPFATMQHYKYRVKLLPGNLKRGNAVKIGLSLIMSENRMTMTPNEKSLLRSVPDAELNSTMPAKVRLTGSGVELTKARKAVMRKK